VNYLVTGTGQAQQTVSGTTATYSGLAAGKSYTFTVRAVTKTPDGETRNGATASRSITVPAQSVSISRGAATTSSNCSGDCAFVNVSMRGFQANTKYSIRLSSSSNNEVATESGTTNSSGSLNYNQLDYDVAGETIYVQVIAPDGTIVKSNSIKWK
jgi:hypothetical protein